MLSKLMILKYYFKYKYRLKFKSRKALDRYQSKQIDKTIQYAIKHAPYFKEVYGDKRDFHTLPLIDKKIMMANFDTFNTLGLKKDHVMSLAIQSEKSRDFTPKVANVSVGLSSGTSGHRGVFLVSEKEKNMWAGAVLAKLLPKGLFSKTNIAFFLRANNNLYESVNTPSICLKYFDMLEDLDSHIEDLNRLKADILIAPPQVLIELAKLRGQGALNQSPDKIISCAEVLQEEDEAFIKAQFGSKIIHQIYQCTEGFLAHTCSHGTLHINEDIVKVEKEYVSENRFIPIITDFTRTSQPIIKYRLNDILVEKNQPCPCGSLFTAIEKIEGREDDTFLFNYEEIQEGEQEGSQTGTQEDTSKTVRVFPDFIRRAITYVDGIQEYKALQVSKNKIVVQIDDISDVQKDQIAKEFQRLAHIMHFRMPELCFEKTDHQPDQKLRRIQRLF